MSLRTPRLLPLAASALCAGLALSGLPALTAGAAPAAAAASGLDVEDRHRAAADIGFHDWTRDGSARVLRNDLTGSLAAQVELVQSSTVNPTGNAAAELPTLVAERTALLLVSPDVADPLAGSSGAYRVEVRVGGTLKGTVALAHPNLLPAADQNLSRGTVAYSRRAWSATLPWQWVRPGLTLTVTGPGGLTGTLAKVDVGAPTEIVVNNIQLGMLTTAPDAGGHRFIKDPANGATDYFQTLPVSKMVMAQYEKVELQKVIVASGAIYTPESPSPQQGGVYNGDMRENVGKAQVSTGINLATWGITSGPMNQSQPGVTNQRVIHHSAGLYANGRQTHGLSGGNGMATLYDSVGNELSHELGHSFGLGHYPGTDTSKTGDDRIRNASHHMDSGWGWIAYRGLMRSNLDDGTYKTDRTINGFPFGENLKGAYNFNTDTMSGGWDASPVSDYTHITGWSQKRIQNSLSTTVADTAYPSGYRSWDPTADAWVDAKVRTPAFNRPAPKKVGVPVFTLLGGYNPATPTQTVLYPAFRSNYGTTFSLPQSSPTATSATRSCWLRVDFASAPTQYVTLDASDGVKQLNVNVAQDERPTGAQVACRVDGTTTLMGDRITIATDLPPMPAAVTVGQAAGFETLRAQELAALQPTLEALAGATVPTLRADQLRVLRGWSDDLSRLSTTARTVARKILDAEAQAADLGAYLTQHRETLTGADGTRRSELVGWLDGQGHRDAADAVLPRGTAVTVDGGKCLTLDEAEDGSTLVRTTTRAADCTGSDAEKWWVDAAGRIHPATRPDLCVRAQTPVVAVTCSTSDGEQRWVLEADGHVVRSLNTGSALDLYRTNHRPGLYGRSTGTNQVWKGFTVSGSSLLAHLTGAQLKDLWSTWVPSVQLLATPDAATRWASSRPTLTVRSADQLSTGPVTSELDLGAGWQPYAGAVTLPEGTTQVRARARTTAGGTSSTAATYRVDLTAPRTTATLDATALTLVATDALSGVASTQYRIGTGAWQAYRGPVTLADPNGVTPRTVAFRSTDIAGHVEEARTLAVSSRPVTLEAGVPSVRQGAQLTATVAVRAAAGEVERPTGVVRLRVGGSTFASGQVVGGAATLAQEVTLAPGSYPVEVLYSGDARFAGATSTATLRVTASATPGAGDGPGDGPGAGAGGSDAVSMQVTLPRNRHGATARAKVTLVPADGSDAVPQGEVRVYAGTKRLATTPVVGGVADVRVATRLAAGKHALRFAYSGDSRFAARSRNATLTVAKASSSVRATIRKKARLTLGASSRKLVVRARVTPQQGARATGTVRFAVVRVSHGRGRVVARMQAPVKSGVASARVPKKVRTVPGSYRVRVTYAGSKDVATSSLRTKVRLTVR